MTLLSERTERLVKKLFPNEETISTVTDILVNECGNNIPFCGNSGPEEMERIRFAALKLSGGNITKLKEAVELAKIDWRDLFVDAGFGYHIDEHEKWYKKTMEIGR